MKTNKKTIQSAMDRRLSFLDERPSCRAAVQYRIAQEEEPVMKKKVSVGFVLAMVLVLLAVAGLATGLLLSPRATATRIADQAMEQERGITTEMMTFFGRKEEELDRMLTDCLDGKAKEAYLEKAREIGKAHGIIEDDSPSEPIEGYHEMIEERKTAAMKARKISEEEMIAIGREFIISNYGLNEEQVSRMELYTNFTPELPEGPITVPEENDDNGWYDMINGKPCFQVEYLLGQPEVPEQEGVAVTPMPREEKDGYYIVYVNVEIGEIEEYEYNSGLGGIG